jgi:hypothetical protein
MMQFPYEIGVVWEKFKGALILVAISPQSRLNVT